MVDIGCHGLTQRLPLVDTKVAIRVDIHLTQRAKKMLQDAKSFDMTELLQSDDEVVTSCHVVAFPVAKAVDDNQDPVDIETVKSFRDRHGLSTTAFTALRRRAERKNPGLVFSSKDADGVQRVQNADVLEALIAEKPPAKNETVEAELLETTELSNGGALTISRSAYEVNLPAIASNRDYQASFIDTTQVLTLVDTINADLQAEQEANRLAKLIGYANNAAKDNADKKLIEALIAKGYSADQAVKIVSGIA